MKRCTRRSFDEAVSSVLVNRQDQKGIKTQVRYAVFKTEANIHTWCFFA